ncbi:MAG TPA: TorF family putative porin, partial [Burkholderiales bacterium]|nr:TorF family putative porin [Burkholderiales bacterium]
MHKSLIAVSVAAALSLPGLAGAQQAAPAAEAKSPHTFTGNLTIISDYRFRGISQTFGKP